MVYCIFAANSCLALCHGCRLYYNTCTVFIRGKDGGMTSVARLEVT